MSRLAKIIIALIVAGGAAGGGIFLYILVTAPRMSVQPHIRTYQIRMSQPPQGSVPVPERKTALLRLTAAQALEAGRTAYGYYCAFCHGRSGDGAGPVGQSYDVTPADLRQPRIQKMSEGELTAAMLRGIGHERVMAYAVPEEYRHYLAGYVKTLGK